MRSTTRTITVAGYLDRQNPALEVDLNPPFQRMPVWHRDNQAWLIATILEGYPIPQMHIFHNGKDPKRRIFPECGEYGMLDGKQRSIALFDFYNNEVSVPHGCRIYNQHGVLVDLSGRNWSYIAREHPDIASRFLNAEVSFSILEDATAEQVRIYFIRLQNGMSLTPAEIRWTMEDGIKAFSVQQLVNPFFSGRLRFTDKRREQAETLERMIALADRQVCYGTDSYGLDRQRAELGANFNGNSPQARKVREFIRLAAVIYSGPNIRKISKSELLSTFYFWTRHRKVLKGKEVALGVALAKIEDERLDAQTRLKKAEKKSDKYAYDIFANRRLQGVNKRAVIENVSLALENIILHDYPDLLKP